MDMEMRSTPIGLIKVDLVLPVNTIDTEATMLVRIMFYNILNLFRREMLPEPESHQRMQTLRSKYFITPALLGRDGKKPVLRLGIRKQNVRLKFIYILDKISTYFSKCNAFDRANAPPATAN
jgi:hypothetical protein